MNKEKIIIDKVCDVIISITKQHWENGDLIVKILEPEQKHDGRRSN